MIQLTDERAVNAVKAALKWVKAHKVEWTASEQKVYSKEHDFCGTLDGTAYVSNCEDITCCTEKFENRLCLLDFKTSNYLYSSFLYQTAAYQGALEEEHPETKIEARYILRLGKDDGEWEAWYLPSETFAKDYATFLECLILKRSVALSEERLKMQKAGIRAAKKAARESAKELAKAQAKADKAAHKAAVKIAKLEEKKQLKEIAKANREAAKTEAKLAKHNEPNVPAVEPSKETIEAAIKSLSEADCTPLHEEDLIDTLAEYTINIPTE